MPHQVSPLHGLWVSEQGVEEDSGIDGHNFIIFHFLVFGLYLLSHKGHTLQFFRIEAAHMTFQFKEIREFDVKQLAVDFALR